MSVVAVRPGQLTHLADNLIDLAGVLQRQVVLRCQAVEVRRALHLAQVLPVLELRREFRVIGVEGGSRHLVFHHNPEIRKHTHTHKHPDRHTLNYLSLA